MGFDQGQIILDSPTGAYYAGQFVDGRLVFELNKEQKIRGIYFTVKGFCKVQWTERYSRRRGKRTRHYTINHEAYEEYITLQLYLFDSKHAEHILNPGKYEYPVKFQLPTTCPSSFEGSSGNVRYELRAVMDIPYAVDKEVYREIRVLAPLDLNTLNCKDPATVEIEQTYCCWCCSSGSSETVVKLPARGFCPGQLILIEVSCQNRSSVEIDSITFSIKKEVSYREQRLSGHKSEEQNVIEMKKGAILPHTDYTWVLEMTVPDMDVHNLGTCSFIDVKYLFKVEVSPSGCHTDEEDSCQIFFGTIPLGVQTNMQPQPYPPAFTPLPQPIINQPVSNNQSYQPNSPFPSNPYPSNSPYPTSNPPSVSPYPGNPPYSVSSPGNNPPYPLEDKPGFRMPDHENSPKAPLLPPGSVPYPIEFKSSSPSSPFAGASAPTTTPDNEQSKPFDGDESNSPFNPAFMDDKKETTDNK